MRKMNVGFIGLGNMGMPMALNLVKAKFDVKGLNRSKEKEETFSKNGGKAGYSIQRLLEESDVIMTCLPKPEDVNSVYLGDKGLFKNSRAKQIFIDFSTVSPDLTTILDREAQKNQVSYLDAPVSGGTVGAENGTLSIMVGGDKKVYDEVTPILTVLGSQLFHTGKVGSGTTIKLINQYLVGVHTQVVSEALVISEKMGIDHDQLFSILSNSFAQSKIYDRHFQEFISKNRYSPGFSLELLTKDISLVNKMMEDNDCKLPLKDLIVSLYLDANQSPYAHNDMSAMYLYNQSKQ